MPHIFQYKKPTPVVVVHGDLILDVHGNGSAGDSSSYNHSIITSQAVSIDTSNKVEGSASLKFVSTSSSSSTSVLKYSVGSESGLGTGDFTLEAWVYLASYGSGRMMIDFRPAGANGFYPSFGLFTAGQLRATTNNAPLATTSSGISLNTWHHVAWSRENGTSRLFIDGQLQTSFADGTNYLSSGNIYLGTNAFFATAPTAGMAGNMDLIEVTAGYAKYTSNFTPPTS